MRLAEIARLVSGEVLGDGNLEVRGIAEPHAAGASDLVLVADRRALAAAEAGGAGALLVGSDVERTARPAVRVRNPRLAFAMLVERLLPERPVPWGVHPACVLGARVRLGSPVALGPCAVVEDDVVIGDRVIIGAGSYVGRGSVIGDDTRIYPNVTVREDTVIGRRVILHPGVVIGADGFGYARREDGRYHKIPHRGRVVIEDDVEIGANATVDRGTLGQTRIGRGTKIDNLSMIAHNVQIGQDVIIIAQAGIAGSTWVGDRVMMGPQSGSVDHVTIGEGARIATRAAVTKDIPPGADVSGFPARPHQEELKAQAMVRRLPDLTRRVQDLAREVADLKRRLASGGGT